MDSYGDEMVSRGENHVPLLTESSVSHEDEACIVNWRISKSHRGAHILRKLFSQFIKEIVEVMIGYVFLPTIMSKLLSDNGSQEFGDFKLTILGMLGIYGFERRILVDILFKLIICFSHVVGLVYTCCISLYNGNYFCIFVEI